MVSDRRELPALSAFRYWAFCDPAGGSGQDSMTLAIAHHEKGEAVLDLVRERRPPFSPAEAVAEFAQTLNAYRVSQVSGVRYEPAEQAKSDLYREFLPLVTSGQVELLDHRRLLSQLCGLERKTARGDHDTIDHAPGAHDDLANAVAGARLAAARPPLQVGDVFTAGHSLGERLRGFCGGSGRIHY